MPEPPFDVRRAQPRPLPGARDFLRRGYERFVERCCALARRVAELDEKVALGQEDCAAAARLARNLGTDSRVDFRCLGRALKLVPDLENLIRARRVSVQAAGALGKVLTPELPPEKTKEWLDRAMKPPIEAFYRSVEQVVDERRRERGRARG